MKTKLSVFDFDGTLMNTPLPDTGKLEYEKITGSPWPHKGWWGRPESMNDEIFDIQPIKEVYDAYQIESKNPENVIVMLTGRIKKLSNEVRKLLDKHSLHFDEYLYNDSSDTLMSKIGHLNSLLAKYPTIKFVHLWDDRLEHAKPFMDWGKENKHIVFDITLINSGNHD